MASVSECQSVFCSIPSFTYFHYLKTIPIETDQIIADARRLLPTYEKLVTGLCLFPSGGESDPLKIQRHERVITVYDLYISLECFEGKAVSDSIQDFIDKRYRVLEVYSILK